MCRWLCVWVLGCWGGRIRGRDFEFGGGGGEEGRRGEGRGSAPLPVRPSPSVCLSVCLTPTYLPTSLPIDRSASSRTRLGSPRSALRWVLNSCSRLARSLTVRFARSSGHGEYAGRATGGPAGSEAEVFFEASGCKGGY